MAALVAGCVALALGCSGSGSGGGAADASLLETVPLGESLALAGLRGRVEVIRDVHGIHHLYPLDHTLDGAFANGYVQARERLFQMDFLRKVAQGRLGEMLGTLDPSILETSVYFRTVFTAPDGSRIEDRLLEHLRAERPEAVDYLQAYCDGVNAYLDDLAAGRNGAIRPQQLRLLDTLFALGSDYAIEPWRPEHVLVLGRLQQWDLSQTLGDEIALMHRLSSMRAVEAGGTIPAGTALDLERAQPAAPTFIVPPEDLGTLTPDSGRALPPDVEAAGDRPPAPARALRERLVESHERVRRFSPFGRHEPGSNNWVVSGALTESGEAMLANDPHLALGNPATFHFVHLDDKTFAGGAINAHGAAFPGIPGILLGQNETLAYGGTVANYDVVDVYQETVSTGTEGRAVFFEGRNRPVVTIQEAFVLRSLSGGASTITVPIDVVPHHGPQVPDPDPTDDVVGLAAGGDMSLRWTGGEMTADVLAFLDLMRAEDVEDFEEALRYFGVGAQNFVGADVDGNISYFPHALIPLRDPRALRPETPPYLPLPGSGGYEWSEDRDGKPAFLPDELLPRSRNPRRGWIVTANNDQIGSNADNDVLDERIYLAYDQSDGFRAARIHERIEQALELGPITYLEMIDIQDDHVSGFGRRLAPRIAAALESPEAIAGLGSPPSMLAEVAARLRAWDGDCPTGVRAPFSGDAPSNREIRASVACSLFHAFASRLGARLVGDELRRAGLSTPGISTTLTVALHLLEDTAEVGSLRVHTLDPATGESRLWDDLATPARVEGSARVLARAMDDGLADLRAFFGHGDLDGWRWGVIHTSTFEDIALGAILPVFNLPSAAAGSDPPTGYPRPGAISTVDPAGFGGRLPFRPGSGPVMRHVVEMKRGETLALNVLPGGQNDLDPDAGPFRPVEIDPAIHYGDELPLWLENQRREQWIDVRDVVENAETRLSLSP